MNYLFYSIVLGAALLLTGCSSGSSKESLPAITYLDSLAGANSELLYNWTEERVRTEESLANQKDLDIKIRSGVPFDHKGQSYVLYPFFRQELLNSKILVLHFLLIKKESKIHRLQKVSFDDLTRMQPNAAYYYFDPQK